MSETSLSDLDPEQLRKLLSVAEEPDARVSPKEIPSSDCPGLSETSPQPGSWIDQYRILERLGEGGMAIVYLAEQQYPVHRNVALKLIKPGMNSRQVIARFEMERQTLTLLNHPNIANIFDAGTTKNGLPYFVMEYVKGLPITDYCDHHKLTIEDRLRLFMQVCQAIYHAHQKGIIHRDIKPSNILVTVENDQAVPKIIDFGIAKAIAQPLTKRTVATEDSQLLGTPEYMSPEQADAGSDDVDTRSDVYSLGVLLYVLITGCLPFDSDTLREGGVEHFRRMMRETDPKTPSARLTTLGEEAAVIAQNRRMEIPNLVKHLRKELEWIPLKAMRKERVERYHSASELSDDIKNYLEGAPLTAAPATIGYRLKKFVRRHKSLVGGAAAVLVVSFSVMIVSLLFNWHQARTLREARLVTDYFYHGVLKPIYEQQDRKTAQEILDNAVKNLNLEFKTGKFKDYPRAEAQIREHLGHAYLWGLKDYEAAEVQFKHFLRTHPEPGHKREGWNALGMAYFGQGRYQEAATELERGVERLRRSGKDEDWHNLVWRNLANVYMAQGRYEEAERLMLETRKRHFKDPNDDPFGILARIYQEQGRYDKAEHEFLRTMAVKKKQGLSTAGTMTDLARFYTDQERYEEAEKYLLAAVKSRRLILGDLHPHTLESLNTLIALYEAWSKPEQANQWRAKLPQTAPEASP